MNSNTELITLAVAVYLGTAMKEFFQSITRDIITPIFAGLIPTSVQSLDKTVITIGGIKLSIGDVISSTLNLMLAYVVVSFTLASIVRYAPIGGRR